jgi:hypothetical protein
LTQPTAELNEFSTTGPLGGARTVAGPEPATCAPQPSWVEAFTTSIETTLW